MLRRPGERLGLSTRYVGADGEESAAGGTKVTHEHEKSSSLTHQGPSPTTQNDVKFCLQSIFGRPALLRPPATGENLGTAVWRLDGSIVFTHIFNISNTAIRWQFTS